jgi:hypothetical protein
MRVRELVDCPELLQCPTRDVLAACSHTVTTADMGLSARYEVFTVLGSFITRGLCANSAKYRSKQLWCLSVADGRISGPQTASNNFNANLLVLDG